MWNEKFNMRNLKDKFRNKISFVKPLYKKVNPNTKHNAKREFVSMDVDNHLKLCGNAIDIGRQDNYKNTSFRNIIKNNDRYNIALPGACQKSTKSEFTKKYTRKVINIKKQEVFDKNEVMIGIVESTTGSKNVNLTKGSKKIPDTWLRAYPAPIHQKESLCSIILRCFLCQMGLAFILLVWTLVWTLVIHYFEGPFETKVSLDFKEQQSQLVIDLATELRQITPVSPKWRRAIEERIDAERQLTISAVGKGARLHPGHFWDFGGTLLFTIFVMTALGFGAPVPQTLWGRTSALIYAIIAVPTHLYLMVHLSTCIVVQAEYFTQRLRQYFSARASFGDGKILDNNKDSPSRSGNSDLAKSYKSRLRKNLLKGLGIFCVGRGIPLVAILYYVLGLAAFGLARSRQPLDVVMFPLEFTTTGGLENVECYVRILYGIYVEGAMVILSCVLATLRRHSTGPVDSIAERYRLFEQEDCSRTCSK